MFWFSGSLLHVECYLRASHIHCTRVMVSECWGGHSRVRVKPPSPMTECYLRASHIHCTRVLVSECWGGLSRVKPPSPMTKYYLRASHIHCTRREEPLPSWLKPGSTTQVLWPPTELRIPGIRISKILQINPFTTGNPFGGTKLL